MARLGLFGDITFVPEWARRSPDSRLSAQTNADDVRRKFEKHGEILDVRLVRDPATKQSRCVPIHTAPAAVSAFRARYSTHRFSHVCSVLVCDGGDRLYLSVASPS